MPSMDPITPTTIQESPIAGKGGEPTAAAPSAASARPVPSNLTPEGVTSLLNSSFAEPETPPAPTGEEVPPAPGSENVLPLPGEPVTPEAPESPDAPTPSGLPEHLEAEYAQWEQSGGTLPPSLQKLVEKRIGKLVGEREA